MSWQEEGAEVVEPNPGPTQGEDGEHKCGWNGFMTLDTAWAIQRTDGCCPPEQYMDPACV